MIGSAKQDLVAYADTELSRIEAQRQEAIKAKGGLPFLGALPVGTSRLSLHAEVPKDHEDPNGNVKKLFTVSKPGSSELLGWTVNPRSPLYRDLLQALKKAPVNIEVVRTGEGKSDTRYSVVIL